MDDNTGKLIIDELKELSQYQREMSECIVKLDKKLSLQIQDLDKKVSLQTQETKYELAKINDLDARQNEILDQHIAGVNTLKKLYLDYKSDTDMRLGKLEMPHKVIVFVVACITGVGTVAGAIYSVMKLAGVLP